MRKMIWVSGIFDQTGPSSKTAMDAAVNLLGPTQFDTIFLNFLHVMGNGTVTYNNTPLNELSPYVATALGRLKNGFPVKKKIVISLGGWGSQNDWDNLNNGNIPGFVKQVSSWAKTAGIDGVDFDFEGFPYDSPYDEVISKTANGYAAAMPGSIVTLTPYLDSDFWTGVLTETATASGNNISWINLMLYMGPTNIGDWRENFKDWLAAVAAPGTKITSAQAPAFIPVGFYANGTGGSGQGGAFIPKDLTAAVNDILSAYPTMGGAFIWSLGQTQGNPGAWAESIAAAGPAKSKRVGKPKR